MIHVRLVNPSGVAYWREVDEVVAWSDNGAYIRMEHGRYRAYHEILYVTNDLLKFDMEVVP